MGKNPDWTVICYSVEKIESDQINLVRGEMCKDITITNGFDVHVVTKVDLA